MTGKGNKLQHHDFRKNLYKQLATRAARLRAGRREQAAAERARPVAIRIKGKNIGVRSLDEVAPARLVGLRTLQGLTSRWRCLLRRWVDAIEDEEDHTIRQTKFMCATCRAPLCRGVCFTIFHKLTET